jgi:hypothetical protein
MLLRNGFTNLYLGGVMVINSPSQAVVMAQTEHFIAGENLNGHAQKEKLHWLSLSVFLFRKKKNTEKTHVGSKYTMEITKLIYVVCQFSTLMNSFGGNM